ncbi:DUF4190 domain-containing protein [Nocardioides sp.]|uniref:DUF4190 domain-containing protein n=1 Tax=Nocardioides sp. TaxID=35761 RepID=UPI003510EDFA
MTTPGDFSPDPWAKPDASGPADETGAGRPVSDLPPAPQDPGAYGQPTYGQAPYGQPAYGQPAYGQAPYGSPYGAGLYTPAPPNESLSVASMVVGIVSFVLACGYGIGLLGSPVALVLGRISMKRIDRSQGTLGGRGFALTGFILGIIGTILLVLAIAAVVVIIIVAANGGFDDTSSY